MQSSRFLTTAASLSRRYCSSAPYKTPSFPQTRFPQQMRHVTGPYEIPGQVRPQYPKRRSPYKRTTALIHALRDEEALRMVHQKRAIFPSKIPNPRSGDIIRICYIRSLSDPGVVHCFTGICIAVRRRSLGSTIVLRNVVGGVAVERGFPIYSPLIASAEVLGRRDVKRAKLYYYRKRPLRDSTVPDPIKRPDS